MHENSYKKMKIHVPSLSDETKIERLERVDSLDELENKFILSFRRILNSHIEYNILQDKYYDDSQKDYKNLGRNLRIKLEQLINEFKGNDLNAVAGTFLQKLFLKVLINGLDLKKLLNENFLNGFFESDGDAEIDRLGYFERQIKGSETAYGYFLSIKDEPDVIFIGSRVDLDIFHNIDLVVVRTRDLSDKNKPAVDVVDLVQIKTSKPTDHELKLIHTKQVEFAKTQKEGILSGIDTVESKDFVSKLEKKDGALVKPYLLERFLFIKDLTARLNSGFFIKYWADFYKFAKDMNYEPTLIIMRLNNLNEFILSKLLSQHEIDLINELRAAISKISIPTINLGITKRVHDLVKEREKTQFATEWNSVVAYKNMGEWDESIKEIKSM